MNGVAGPDGAGDDPLTLGGPAAGRRGHQRRRKVRAAVAAVVVLGVVAAVLAIRNAIDGLDTSTQAVNPAVRWEWLFLRDRTFEELREATIEHLYLTVVAVTVGFVLAAALAAIAIRFRWTFSPITAFTGFLYTIPSVALFGVLTTRLSNFQAAEIALISYTLLILVRNMVAGIDGVSSAVTDAADGMGMSRARRLATVEIPLALPVIIAGLRVATVTTIGLVAISSIIQLGGLGDLIFAGFRDQFYTEMVVGSVLSIIVAVVLDLALFQLERSLTPWSRRRVA
ncbi:ABC transporter permease [soil metagenome]